MDTMSPAPTKRSLWKELVSYAFIAFVIVVPVRLWIAQPFVVNGASMDTTFADGEYLVVDELSYHFREPQRGEILIFKYPEDPSKYFIKRLIGLPGETVVVKSDSVSIVNAEHPKGVTLNEPYTHSRTFGTITTTLGPDEYFVMGDNRLVSSDSRIWGPLPKEDIVGRPVVRLLPIGRADVLPGQVASSTMTESPKN
jgi:signal peptidase I